MVELKKLIFPTGATIFYQVLLKRQNHKISQQKISFVIAGELIRLFYNKDFVCFAEKIVVFNLFLSWLCPLYILNLLTFGKSVYFHHNQRDNQ